MSRRIFRRFLRYITLSLDLWEAGGATGKSRIDEELVKEAVTTERLAADMELELLDLFPKHSDLRFLAVRLLMHLEEYGAQRQSQLADVLDAEPYEISRLLTKLEHSRYISRAREGTDKMVSLRISVERTISTHSTLSTHTFQ